MAEKFGVQGRGAFYEEVGAIRDVVQNHLLQVIALLAMDAPAGHEPQAMQAEKLRAVSRDAAARPEGGGARPVHAAIATRRAWPRTRRSRLSPRCGCTSTPGVGPGVPFYIRTGKCLPHHRHRGAA